MRRLHLEFVTLGDHSYVGLVVEERIHLPAVLIAQRLGAPVLAVYVSIRHAVWFMTGVFVLLNGLTVVTFQPLDQILLCLARSFVVVGTHFWRQSPQIALVFRQRQWRKFMTIE